VYNSHEYLPYKSWAIWTQNAKVMAKKQIRMHGMTGNSTGVSCIHPSVYETSWKIQIKHVRDHMGKENTTISQVMDWNFIMFDHKGVKIVKVIWSLSFFFLHVKLKKPITKKYDVQGHNIHIPINLRLFKIYFTNFLNY